MKWLSGDKSHNLEKVWSLALRLSEPSVSFVFVLLCVWVLAPRAAWGEARGTISTLLWPSQWQPRWNVLIIQSWSWRDVRRVAPDTSRILHLMPSYCLPSPVTSEISFQPSKIHQQCLLGVSKPKFPHPRQSRPKGQASQPAGSIIIGGQAQVTGEQDQTKEQL